MEFLPTELASTWAHRFHRTSLTESTAYDVDFLTILAITRATIKGIILGQLLARCWYPFRQVRLPL